MSKNNKNVKSEDREEVVSAKAEEMTLAEAKAYRKSLAKAEVVELTMDQKKEQFRLFWAKEKNKYGKAKELEQILWLHLVASGNTEPAKFEDGLKHFGLKKLGN